MIDNKSLRERICTQVLNRVQILIFFGAMIDSARRRVLYFTSVSQD